MKNTVKTVALLAAGLAFACFGCKVNLDPSYTIEISEAEHGNVTASASSATAGSAITLTVTPESGYNLGTLTVTDASGNTVSATEATAGEKYTFTMPASNVTVSATFTDIMYDITISEAEHGNVTASASSATAGSAITLTVTPESGYNLGTLTVTDASGNTVSATEATAGEKYTFTMPASNVTVSATFTDIMYDITVSEAEHGNVTASASSATAGSAITLTVAPESGYSLDTLTVTDASGNTVSATEVTAGEKYTFTMPSSNVNVSATFVKLCTVTFDSMGGSEVPSQTVAAGRTATKPADPTREGYVFLYWSADNSNEFDFSGNFIADDITLYAMWRLNDVFVEVKGGTFDGTKTLTPSSGVFISGRSLTIGDLYVSDHEVTQAEYETYCKYGSSSPSDSYGKGDNFPAYYVNWYDAVVYCNLRSIAENLTPAYSIGTETDPSKWTDIQSSTTDGTTKYCGPSSSNSSWNNVTFNQDADGFRLPTEAEWEYIARGENKDSYTYSGSGTVGDVAWYSGNSGDKSHEVKTKTANSLGIYDMSGNVWEWCYDWYSSSITTSTPATGAASGSYRVGRGGSWVSIASSASVSFRGSNYPLSRINYVGFRVVRSSSK